MFSADANAAASSSMPRPSALKLNRTQRDSHSEEYTAILKFLAQALENENMTARQFFDKCDVGFNRVLTCDELKESVKVILPGQFGGLNYKKLGLALDINNSGIIE